MLFEQKVGKLYKVVSYSIRIAAGEDEDSVFSTQSFDDVSISVSNHPTTILIVILVHSSERVAPNVDDLHFERLRDRIVGIHIRDVTPELFLPLRKYVKDAHESASIFNLEDSARRWLGY